MPVADVHAPPHRLLALVVVTLFACTAGPLAAQDAPETPAPEPGPVTISFDPSGLLVSGLTPGGEGLAYGVTRARLPYFWHQYSVSEVLPADASGVATLDTVRPDSEVEAPTEVRTVWLAADGSTGRFTIAGSPGFVPVEVEFPARGLSRAPNGLLRVLRSRFGRGEMLVLRPGVGAWRVISVDGAASDADEVQDSGATFSLDGALPVWSPAGGDAPAPDELAAGDVLVVVSLDDLRFFAVTLTAPGPEA